MQRSSRRPSGQKLWTPRGDRRIIRIRLRYITLILCVSPPRNYGAVYLEAETMPIRPTVHRGAVRTRPRGNYHITRVGSRDGVLGDWVDLAHRHGPIPSHIESMRFQNTGRACHLRPSSQTLYWAPAIRRRPTPRWSRLISVRNCIDFRRDSHEIRIRLRDFAFAVGIVTPRHYRAVSLQAQRVAMSRRHCQKSRLGAGAPIDRHTPIRRSSHRTSVRTMNGAHCRCQKARVGSGALHWPPRLSPQAAISPLPRKPRLC